MKYSFEKSKKISLRNLKGTQEAMNPGDQERKSANEKRRIAKVSTNWGDYWKPKKERNNRVFGGGRGRPPRGKKERGGRKYENTKKEKDMENQKKHLGTAKGEVLLTEGEKKLRLSRKKKAKPRAGQTDVSDQKKKKEKEKKGGQRKETTGGGQDPCQKKGKNQRRGAEKKTSLISQ